MLKLTYKGRTFTNGRALAGAMTRDFDQEMERRICNAASATGVRVRKTHKGFEIEGEANSMTRFNNRLGR